MFKEGPWSFIGIDESNHGQSPEIFAAVFSDNHMDAIQYPTSEWGKDKRKKKFPARLRNKHRDYTFVTYGRDRRNIHRDNRFYGMVIASLLSEMPLNEKGIQIYLDGSFHKIAHHIPEIVSSVTSLTSDKIEVHSGPRLDTRVGVTNIADEVSRYLFKKGEEFCKEHPHGKRLLEELGGYLNTPFQHHIESQNINYQYTL